MSLMFSFTIRTETGQALIALYLICQSHFGFIKLYKSWYGICENVFHSS